MKFHYAGKYSGNPEVLYFAQNLIININKALEDFAVLKGFLSLYVVFIVLCGFHRFMRFSAVPMTYFLLISRIW